MKNIPDGYGWGKFYVSAYALVSRPDDAQRIFANVIPTRIEHDFARSRLECVGYSKLFDAHKKGCEVTEYEFWFDSMTGTTKAKKILDGCEP